MLKGRFFILVIALGLVPVQLQKYNPENMVRIRTGSPGYPGKNTEVIHDDSDSIFNKVPSYKRLRVFPLKILVRLPENHRD